MPITKSEQLFKRAQAIIPGGVNSPVRAFKSVGGSPIFMREARGATIIDADGRSFIDFVGSWGPFILGHSHPEVQKAITTQAALATSFGAPTELEIELAELITKTIPSIEMVRMVNSGTEATMSAIRLARAYTSREKIIKFEGCYHGHGDSFLIKAGSGAMTLGIPDSPGVTRGTANDTLIATFNDISSVEKLFLEHPDEIACIIVEPIGGNMGVVAGTEKFLAGLRSLATKNKSVLIFDEVMTGYRVALGGAQSLFNIKPDLTTLGKIIGGGLPVGAYGGKKEIMQMVAPSGPVYQAGTLSGNPLAMAAGIATLTILLRNKPYEPLEKKSKFFEQESIQNAKDAGVATVTNRVGSMMTTFFTSEPVTNYPTALASDTKRYGKYFHAMLDRGIYLAPSQFEAMFISIAHTAEQIDRTLEAQREAFKQL